MLAARPGRSSSILRTWRRACATGSRHDWQSLSSGLRIKHVRLSAHGGLIWAATKGCCPCTTQVSDGNQGDEPVGDNQTIRVTYTARLEDDTELITNRVASFKVGTSSQVLPAAAPPHRPRRRRTPADTRADACGVPGSDLPGARRGSARYARWRPQVRTCRRLRCRREALPHAAVMHLPLAKTPPPAAPLGRVLRAPFNMTRGPAVAAAPKHAVRLPVRRRRSRSLAPPPRPPVSWPATLHELPTPVPLAPRS